MNWFYRMASASQQRIDFLARKFDRLVDRKTIEMIANHIDPSPNGQFTPWLVNLHAKGPGNPGYFPVTQASIDWIRDVLTAFMRYKNSPSFKSPKDINQYKNVDSLENALREPMELSKQERARQNANAGQKIIYQDSNYKVLAITSSEAATQYCKNTAICLKDPHIFSQYHIGDRDPVYIILKFSPSQTGFGNGFTNPNMEPYAVFFPRTGEFNAMDNNSIFEHGIGEELVGLIKKVPNGQQMLEEYLSMLISRCENPRFYAKEKNTLKKAITIIDATLEQAAAYQNIVEADPGNVTPEQWEEARFQQQQVPVPQPAPNQGNVPAVW